MPVIDIHQQLFDALEVVRTKKAALDHATDKMNTLVQQQQAVVLDAERDYNESAKKAHDLHEEFSKLVQTLLPAASRSRSA